MRSTINSFLFRPLHFTARAASFVIRKLRSKYYSTYIDSGGGQIIVSKPFIKIKIIKHKKAKLHIDGKLFITPFLNGNSIVVINIGEDATLRIGGDFVIGDGVKLSLSKKAELLIGGRKEESASGITADTLIMVHKRVVIGNDFICAWGVFITDCDWHKIEGQSIQEDVVIGNHVWVANSCNILKGTSIGDNSIVASNSKVISSSYDNNSLIAGIPAKCIRKNISWFRDFT